MSSNVAAANRVSNNAVGINQPSKPVANNPSNNPTNNQPPQATAQSIEKSINSILEYGVRARATDIHIEPRDQTSIVRYRIDGSLGGSMALRGAIHDQAIKYLISLAKLDEKQKILPQKGVFEADFGNLPISFQLYITPTISGQKAVIHVINHSNTALTLADLGMGEQTNKFVESCLNNVNGAVLIASPDAISRSSVLYGVLSYFDNKINSIATLEKTITYKISDISQTELDEDSGLKISQALQNIINQDVDVVMVSDVADSKTAELLIDASLRGKKVLAGLSTTDAVGTILRLSDMGIEPFLVASTVKLIIASQLVRKLCPYCKKVYTPSGEELNNIKAYIGEVASPKQIIQTLPSPYDETHAAQTHKKVIPAPSKDELVQKTILDRISSDPNFVNRSLDDGHNPQQQTTDNNPQPTNGSSVAFYQAIGCGRCNNTGYLGQIALFEVLPIEKEIQDGVAAGKAKIELKNIASRSGMTPIAKDGFDKAAHGLTTIAEVLRVV